MASETEILRTLMSAATGQQDWATLLQALAETTRAETVALRFDRNGRQLAAWHHGPPPPDLGDSEKMRLGRVYAQGDLPGLSPRRRPLRAMRTAAGPGGSAVLLLQRGARDEAEDFRAIDSVQLSALEPYLGPALLGWQAQTDARRRAALDRGLARDLGASWILFSATGQVLDRGADGDALLAGTGLRVTGDGRLAAAGPGPADDILPQLRLAVSRTGPGQPVVTLRVPPPAQLDIRISAGADGTRLARLRQPPRAADLSVARLADHLGLAPSEARLAQLICDGHALVDAARTLGWTVETTRSISKQVYARMGVSGQAGVVRQMLAGAVWLGVEGTASE